MRASTVCILSIHSVTQIHTLPFLTQEWNLTIDWLFISNPFSKDAICTVENPPQSFNILPLLNLMQKFFVYQNITHSPSKWNQGTGRHLVLKRTFCFYNKFQKKVCVTISKVAVSEEEK